MRLGLRAVVMGAQATGMGDAEIMVVGGQESMSQAPHLYLRNGTKWAILDDRHMIGTGYGD